MPKIGEALLSEVTEEAITLLIDRFYAAVRQEPVLGPVFESAICPEAWPEHLATMRRFWSSVTLASGRYSGNPVAVHRAVPDLQRPMFARWLDLFEKTVRELFVPDVARQFMAKAQRIAASLQLALFHKPGQPPEGLALPPRKPTALPERSTR
ncbi:MAG: hemoglobin [Acetobacteraceae bacterium]|jgi:hemoglobin|nr:hemoglobin [Acetobacteraceae bacterium]